MDMASAGKGFRKEVDHKCIVITDGISRKPAETKLAAEKLHEAGMEVIAIGNCRVFFVYNPPIN